MKRLPLIIAGIIFTIVALLHLVRVIYDWQITIADYMVPMYFSYIGVVVAAILAIWMFTTAAKD